MRKKKDNASKKEVIVIIKRSGSKVAPVKKIDQRKMNNEFRDRVRRDLNEVLPKKVPWKIRIDRDLFAMLKEKYPGERGKLRRAIGAILNKRTSTMAYMKATQSAKCRYGFELEEYPLDEKHRRSCKQRIIEMKILFMKGRKNNESSNKSDPSGNCGHKSLRNNIRNKCNDRIRRCAGDGRQS